MMSFQTSLRNFTPNLRQLRADKAQAILEKRMAVRRKKSHPVVGEWLRGRDGSMSRITEREDGWVRGGGQHGDFYLGTGGTGSYSGEHCGELFREVDLHLTNEVVTGLVWIFDITVSPATYEVEERVWST